MQRLISDITIGERHRKKMGDIEGLARSIEAVGLLHPVVIDKDCMLIAGERRIRALLFLGRVKIPVTVVDLAEIVRGEFAENTDREEFTITEAVSIKRAVEPLLASEAKARMAAAGPSTGKGKKRTAPAKLADPVKGETRDNVAKRTGKKRSTLTKAEAVVAAAEANPEKFGRLPRDGSGRPFDREREKEDRRCQLGTAGQGQSNCAVASCPPRAARALRPERFFRDGVPRGRSGIRTPRRYHFRRRSA
jgi:hypothetical protein